MEKENKVYSAFFTNTAVAWFTAGVVTPIFTGLTSDKVLSLGTIAVIATLFFLNLATDFAKRK